MSKGKILIVDDLHPAFKIAAEEMGFEVDDLPLIKKEEVLQILPPSSSPPRLTLDREVLLGHGQD